MGSPPGYAIVNARIVRDYSERKLYSGIVIHRGTVVYVGDSEGAKRVAGQLGLDIIDKRGLYVLPGFIDAHMHLESLGIALESVDLRDASSIEELISAMRQRYARDRPPVLIGRGWDHEKFAERRMPIARDLDRVSRDVPVVVSRICGHVVSANTAALEILRDRLREFDDRLVPRDSAGEPIGLLFEDAGYLAWELAASFFDKRKVIKRAIEELLSLGVTSVGWMSVKSDQLDAVGDLYARGDGAKIRVHLYVDPSALGKAEGLKARLDDETISVRGVKLFADGSLGARTAYLSEDYSDMPNWRGILLIEEARALELISDIISRGLQPAVHAIGDEAARIVLRIYKRTDAGRVNGRIEHASLAFPDIIMGLIEAGAIAVVQPRFVISDWWARERLGPRARYLYPLKTMYEHGVAMALSTDSPVEPPSPWLTVQAAESNGSESLTREISLYLYTVGSARSIRRGDLGRLSEGYRADFIVTDFDPFDVSTEELGRVRVLETYVNGQRVHRGQATKEQ